MIECITSSKLWGSYIPQGLIRHGQNKADKQTSVHNKSLILLSVL